MQVRVLGPIQVRSAAGAVGAPSGGKQRLLLAALLLRAPRVVPSDRLIDHLWGERLPEDPAAALRTHVSRLRAFLQEVAPEREVLRSEPSGYRLAVEPGDVDAGQFEAIQARARDEPDPERQVALLEEALGLWRGEPYGEFHDLPLAQGEVARLRELRTGVVERRIECLLRLGRTSEALAAAEPLVHADPLRERPRALCMKALYRAGRQGEALSVFQEYRRLLSEELGLDPSPALRQLEAELLRHRDPPAPPPSAPPASASDPPVRHDSPAPASPDPPGEAPAPGRPPRVPLPLTRLVGRERELSSVRRLIRSTRLLTLTGSGGSGKTRLALEVSRALPEELRREVVWVGFEALSDPASVVQEVASVLGVRERPDRSATESLEHALASREALLVLDNCEHLVEACAELAAALLRACPGVSILATSREPLGVPGETTWPVPPLSVPAEGSTPISELVRCPAVELFIERARAALPSFELTETNAAAVARICRQLDGIPLAIELAAARVRVLSPPEITVRLESDFDLLSGGHRAALPRHQTIRAAIDWSYWLLSSAEQRLLARLSAFAGGFTLPAAETVCADEGLPAPEVLGLLSGLVERSLVLMHEQGGETRYRLLESVRQYAAERLRERGEEVLLRDRHAEHFRGLAERAEPHLFGGAGDPLWISRVDRDDRNLLAAVRWCLADESRIDSALGLLSSLHWYWFARGRFREGRQLLAAALRMAEHSPPELRAKALTALGIVGVWQGDADSALAPLGEGVEILRGSGDERALAYALTCLGAATLGSDPAAARAICAEAAALVRPQPRGVLHAFVLFWNGLTALASGDDGAAHDAFEEAVSIGRALRNKPSIAHPLAIFGRLEEARGNHREALACFAESLAIHRELGDVFGAVLVLEGVAAIEAARGQPDRAVRLFGAAEALRDSIGGPLLPFEEARYRGTIEDLAGRMDPASHRVAWAVGRAMDFEQVIRLASTVGGGSGGDLRPPVPEPPR